MFQEWGFLLTEMWVLLALAALVGLIAGWIIWGRRAEVAKDTTQEDGLRVQLEKCRALHGDKDARIRDLEAAASAPVVTPAAPIPAVPTPAAPVSDDCDDTGEGVKPATLDAPHDGMADDLKKIKGIGAKMEKLCNKLGFWHFDQIANWSADEVAWVDANLEGFKGRVTRDDWVAQAALLAGWDETTFSKKVDGGDVD